MNTVFLMDWGTTIKSALKKPREFDRWCGLFVKAVCGFEFSEQDLNSRAYEVFVGMNMLEKIEKANAKYVKRVERSQKKREGQNADSQENEVGNTNTSTNTITNTSTITNTNLKNITEKCVKRKKFVPPTTEELQAYINEKGYHFTADEFIDHYKANGWKVGRDSMKDWKATANNWERRRNQFNNQNNYNNGRTNNNSSNNGIPKFNDGFSGNYPPEQETIHLD